MILFNFPVSSSYWQGLHNSVAGFVQVKWQGCTVELMHAWFEYICPEDREDGRISDDESPGKYAAMFERRARNGQCFHRPYLGCREFACYFRLVEDKDDSVIQPIQEDRDLGWMLYDMDFSNPKDIQAQFFHAVMQQGIVNSDRRVVEVRQ